MDLSSESLLRDTAHDDRALLETNKHFFSKTADDIVMSHGEGVYLFDTTGNRYIDCASATFNLNLGYGNQEVIDAAFAQARRLIHATSSYMTSPVGRLVGELAKVLPNGLSKVHLKVSGGSVANEGAIKMAQYRTKRWEVISMFRSHLGQTIYTMNLSGNAFRREPFSLKIPGILHVPAPYCHRCFYKQKPETCGQLCVSRINDFIQHASSGSIAAVIIEPIFGNGDNIVPPPEYFPALRKLCDERGIALIFDEIQTGFGRTGHMFAAEHFGVVPDLLTMAKGLGGTGFQVAAIACKPEYADMDGMHHSFTFGSNVMASAAALKTLEILQRPGFLEHVRAVGNLILEKLHGLKRRYPCIDDIRGVGLMLGIEISRPDGTPDVELTNKLKDAGFEKGLLLRTSRYGHGNVLKVRPPLIITEDEAEELCIRLERTFASVCGTK